MRGTRIYLDHAATTPVLPEARAAMLEGLECWANPSSPHADGRAAKAALERARSRLKEALDWNGEVIFTGGATDSARLAFRRCHAQGPKPAVSTVEHEAILRQAPEGERFNLPVGANGLLDPDGLTGWLRLAPGGLIVVQHCNNETGVVQPIDAIVEAVDTAGSYLLADCAQSAGKMPLPRADLIMLSAHKFGGPPGIGALLVRDLKLLVPEGGQERGYRGGTENLPAILAMVAALESWAADNAFERQSANRALLEDALGQEGATVIAKDVRRSPFIGAYAMPHMSAVAQLVRLDAMGFSVSAGSACSSGSTKTSPVLAAMGVDPALAANVIRVSFGKDTSASDVMTFAAAWTELARDARIRAA